MGKTNIIIDTNLWISFLISKDFSKLDRLITEKNCRIVFSQELLKEFLEVAQRPKFNRFFTNNTIELVCEIILEYGFFIEVSSRIDACRDEKDNYLLALALDGNADYLLTVDNDLLVLKKIGNTIITTISAFLELNR